LFGSSLSINNVVFLAYLRVSWSTDTQNTRKNTKNNAKPNIKRTSIVVPVNTSAAKEHRKKDIDHMANVL
jgi:hypothetical protein